MIKFNPFTGNFDFVGGGGGTTAETPDEMTMLEEAIIEGEFVVEDNALVVIKNSLASAFQIIKNQVTVKADGQVEVGSLAGLEVNNG